MFTGEKERVRKTNKQTNDSHGFLKKKKIYI